MSRPDRLGRLDAERRAMVIAAVLREGPRAERVLERGPDGPLCAEASRDLAALPARDRERRLLVEVVQLFAAPPAHLERVHPSWLADATAEEPPHVVRAARSGHAPAPVVLHLRRRLLGQLVAMPEGPPPPQTLALDDLPRLPAELLVAVLATLGRRWIAWAFGGAGSEALAQLSARLAEPQARALLADAQVLPPAVVEVRWLQKEVLTLLPGIQGGEPLLLRIGTRRLGATLRGRGDLPRRVAQRLPVELGRWLLTDTDRPAPPDPSLLDEVRAVVGSAA
jgi:hypothetical protein